MQNNFVFTLMAITALGVYAANVGFTFENILYLQVNKGVTQKKSASTRSKTARNSAAIGQSNVRSVTESKDVLFRAELVGRIDSVPKLYSNTLRKTGLN